MLILKIGLVPDRHGTGNSLRQSALDPGFMTFRRVRHARTVMLMVPT
jgi:hypothetical protein